LLYCATGFHRRQIEQGEDGMTMSKRFAILCLVVGMAAPLATRADEAPGTFKIPGTDSTIKFYGYAQLDITYDLRSRTPDSESIDWATQQAIVPLDGSAAARNQSKQLYMTARTSRFGVESNTPTVIGNVGVKLEGDFNSPNPLFSQSYTNSVLFRLRQGYGTVSGSYGTILAGQTWTTFLDLASYPDVVDFNGPGSIPLVRQPMIKYTTPSISGFTLAVAAENAPGQEGNDLCYDNGVNTPPDCGPVVANSGTVTGLFQTIPDFTADLRTSGAWGHFSLRGVVRDIRVANVTVPGAGYKEAWAGAASASGSFKFMGDTLVALAVAGSPGRYLMNNIGNGGSRGVVTDGATGEMFPWDALAYHVGYTHVWAPVLRSNLVFSQTFFKPNTAGGRDDAAHQDNQRITQGFVNTFWTFAKNAEWGIEYTLGQRRTFGSATNPAQVGTESRINSTFHYNFF
jgi:hypothetical protein